ncbi:MAG: carboxypeptidase regulatory-like domain-containing protein [Gemmatimonadales bacterium]|nr:carboxypeptidase regulatory-like domain-containing protein [Gemmatimonadales bacterium]
MKRFAVVCAVLASAVVMPAGLAAQGVTTSSMTGVVTASGNPVVGASVRAVHTPSGTGYAATTRGDGRYTIPGMRVGGPYEVTVRAIGYTPQSQKNIVLSLGVAADVSFRLEQAVIQLTEITVTEPGELSSNRTGAATRIKSEVIEALPTIARSLNDVTRLTPQASGASFAGQDTRFNNITVDGSFFNNSFGLAGQPGGRTGVSPISLDAIDQIQVNIAPYDVRQGNFTGAGINAVTKSGTNDFEASFYRIQRSQGLVGTDANGVAVNPGTFNYGLWGARVGGPIVKDKLFFFFNFEDDGFNEPATLFRANNGGEPVSGNTTRVLRADLDSVSRLLANPALGFVTGPYEGWNLQTPSRRWLGKLDFNVNDRNKVSIRYQHLDSRADIPVSNSASLGFGNRRDNLNSMSFANSAYGILENIRSIVGEWNSQLAPNLSNQMILGYTTNDESREPKSALFPTIDILRDGLTYIGTGFEPFTNLNQLRYRTWQFQNNLTLYADKHELTFGVALQKYNSDNVFFDGSQSVYTYNSLQDFYTDMNSFIANPNRTGNSPVSLRRFQLRFNNIPGLAEPLQPLEVLYSGFYAQDEWRPSSRLKVTAGVRVDVPNFAPTGFANRQVDGLFFRDERGLPAQYRTDQLPGANLLWSPRVGFNLDVTGDRSTQIRGGSGIFTGSPPYVWISNQVGNNGTLTGFIERDNTNAFPFNPNPATYAPATVTGQPAASYALAFTEPGYRFPQLWRTNIALDQKLPWGVVFTGEFLYSRDVNGTYYINANLAQPTGRFTGADNRFLYGAGTANRVNSNITSAIVLKNQNEGYSYSIAGSLEKAFSNGFFAKVAYNYGVARNIVDPGSIALGSWTGNAIPNDPNNAPVAFSNFSPGHRAFLALSYRKEYFKFGATTITLFAEGRTQGNTQYTFGGDANRDGGVGNDLIYVPRNTSEMNFQTYTQSGVTFTRDQQAQAWDAYISQDPYLSTRRGQYAERGAIFLPMLWRADLSVQQEIFQNFGRKKNTLSVRLDVLNFTNFVNSGWGVGDRLISNQPLVIPTAAQGGPVDANGALQYRLRAIGATNPQLMNTTFERTATLGDVWRMQLSFRYTFN